MSFFSIDVNQLIKFYPHSQQRALGNGLVLIHHVGRTLSSDWSLNSFTMVVCEGKNVVLFKFGQKILTEREKNLIDNHYIIIYEPVRTECSSCRVSLIV